MSAITTYTRFGFNVLGTIGALLYLAGFWFDHKNKNQAKYGDTEAHLEPANDVSVFLFTL